MAKDQQLTVEPSPLEMHGDEVAFEMSALLPANMLKKNTLYTVTTYYQFGDQKLELGTIEFKQTEFPNKTVQPKMSKKFSFPYKEEYKRGKVMIKGTAAKVTGKSLESPEMEVAEGIITTPELVVDEAYAAYAFHGYNNQEELIPTYVDFFFASNSAKLNVKERKGEEGKKMGMFIADKKVTRTVNIYGHHSPEGTETINSGLSENRAEAIETFYRKEMKKYDYKDMADSIKFVLTPITFKWKLFRDAVKATSELSEGEKKQVLKIIDVKGADFMAQEKQLQTLPFYKTIKSKIYPEVRTAKTEILSVKEKKTDAEIATLAGLIVKGEVSIDTLNTEELGYAATLTEDLNAREQMYLSLTKKTESWHASNNLGAVYLSQAMAAPKSQKDGLVEKALSQLNISVKKKETAENLNNLAVAHTMKGNRTEAKEFAQKALKASKDKELTKQIKSNLAPQHIRDGEYSEAVNLLSSSTLSPTSNFNMGLAQLLSKDFETAKGNLNKANTDGQIANSYYAAAVAAARTSDESTMAARLKKAIELNADLRTRAIDDLEFKRYWEAESFKGAIK